MSGKSAAEDWTVVGAAMPDTQAAVDSLDCGTDAGLRGADPSFSSVTFTAWSQTVFERAVKAWQTGKPEPLHPVMQDLVWDHYAQWLLFIRAVPFARTIMAAARATPAWVGAVAGAGYHSAMVEYTVHTQAPAGSVLQIPPDEQTWRERWLFQRPATCQTHASGAVAVCPVCGAPAEPEETGKCRYCHADITTRTAGWLVTRTATTMRGAKRLEQRMGGSSTSGALPQQPGLLQPPRAAPMQPPRAAPIQPPRAGPA